ncbi:MAG TPA: polysaccharide deacetylase family protein [Candidatus Krumholzibacteria bacterium]|nr:polysaccharide deacetylase family protein [Candidatus Krumholzibacteria bacterium]
MRRFPTLMYHRIVSGRHPAPDPVEAPWSVDLGVFERQMERLHAAGRRGVSMDQVHRTLAGGGRVPPDWVAITFDDGNASDHGHALPVLARHGFAATFFVCGNRVDAATGLSRAEIREMHGAGMHIGSHAMTHRFLTTLDGAAERDELAGSRALLEDIIGAPVDHFAPPGGRWSARTGRVLRELSFAAVSSSAFGYNDAGRASFAYRRIPIVRSTPPARFDAIARGARLPLLPGYARAFTLSLVRGALGESGYARARSMGGAA